MYSSDPLQNWFSGLDRRVHGAFLGAAIGLCAGILALMLAVAGPIVTVVAVLAMLGGLYVLTSASAALYAVILTVILLPFGVLPVKIALTPTLLDIALAAFVVVYVSQWMTGRRQLMRLTPVHVLIVLYVLWLILSFVLGLRYAPPTPATLRQLAETLLSISLVFALVDMLREPATLRRLVLVVIAAIGVQALIALALYALPDATAEIILIRLARIGYPDGGVVRYIEDNPALAERAIGTWVDPNALGGALAVMAAMIAPQVFAQRPILRFRWLTLAVLGLVTLALYLTYSRASMLALAAGLTLIAFVRYRKLIPLLILAGGVFLVLPQTQSYIDRLVEAFAGADLATQMRLGEYGDSFRLISRYPIFGVGFTGMPEIGLYTDVASMYLIMANQIGLVGLAIFGVAMAGVFVYGLLAWKGARTSADLDSIHLGYHAALFTGLCNAIADLYFFRLDFQSSITLFWLLIALALASSRLTLSQLHAGAQESTVAKSG